MRVLCPGLPRSPRGKIVGGTRKARRGKPDPKQRNQKGPCPPAFSYQEKDKSVALKTPIEKTKRKKGPKRAGDAGKGRGSDRLSARGRGLHGGGAL